MPHIAAPAVVRTERLIGRSVREADLPYLREVDSDIRIQAYVYGDVQSEEQLRARLVRWLTMWRDCGMGFWIFRDQHGAIVGHGGLFPSPREPGEIEVGYVIKPAYWGRGYATEITRHALRIGATTLGLSRIIAVAQARNVGSRRVLEKAGMSLEREFTSSDGLPGVLYAIAGRGSAA